MREAAVSTQPSVLSCRPLIFVSGGCRKVPRGFLHFFDTALYLFPVFRTEFAGELELIADPFRRLLFTGSRPLINLS